MSETKRTDSKKMRVMTFKGFLERFDAQNCKQVNKPFCFIIGAGASRSSKIRTGKELATEWLKDLHRDHCFTNEPLEKWATPENVEIEKFDHTKCELFYTKLYEKRFGKHSDEGYAFIENEMEGKIPGIGYALLANILSNTPHRIVITTNFDNLISDAITFHGDNFPLVLGHESLAVFASATPRRPVIAKIHGSLGFNMINDSNGVEKLEANWKKPLEDILARYTPVVIGYAGNDGSLMKLLNKVELNNIYWLHYQSESSHNPETIWNDLSQSIQSLVEKCEGYIVPVKDFDLTMMEMAQKLGIITDIKKKLTERVKKIMDAIDTGTDTAAEDQFSTKSSVKPVQESHKEAVPTESEAENDTDSVLLNEALNKLGSYREIKPWWMYQEEINGIENPEEKEQAFRDALVECPESHELMGNFAIFLKNIRINNDEAERLYRKAIEIKPNNATHLGNFANFLTNIRQNHDEAERLYRKAIEIDPNHTNNLGNFATFLRNIRKNYDEAESLYRKAIAIDPDSANRLGHFALFLTNIRQNHEEAESLYRKAIEIDPNSANNLGNFASLLLSTGKNDEGFAVLNKGESQTSQTTKGDIISELRFYRCCHDQGNFTQNLPALKASLLNGDRSPNWSFVKNIARAEEIGHPNVPLLKAAAAVICDGADISILDEFPDWVAA